jgi:hypothetical protein
MTLSRKYVYRRGWYNRECMVNKRKRRREYNRMIRHSKGYIGCGAAYKRTGIQWDIMS